MALTERRYIFLSRGGLVQRAPLQTQSVHTILTAACTDCKCLPEIATSAYGLLAMTNLVAGAVGGVHRNLQLPMALTERRYIFLSRGGLVQRAPLQTQLVHTILTAAC